MSRIGKAPVPIPAGVEVRVEGRQVSVRGPKGSLQRTFHPDVQVSVQDRAVLVAREIGRAHV